LNHQLAAKKQKKAAQEVPIVCSIYCLPKKKRSCDRQSMHRSTAFFKRRKRPREREEVADRCIGWQLLTKETGKERERGLPIDASVSNFLKKKEAEREKQEVADQSIR